MSPLIRFVAPALLLTCTTALIAGDPIRDTGWSYYGLNGEGPRIVTHGKDFQYGTPLPLTWGQRRCAPGISLYDPPSQRLGPLESTCGQSLATTPPKNLVLGWFTSRTPSPRGGTSVGVWP